MIAVAAIRTRDFPVTHESSTSDAVATLQDTVVAAITDTLDCGVVLVDRHAHVLFANAGAQLSFQTNQMINRCGVLRAPTAAETSTLHQMIARCAQWRADDGDEAVGFCRAGYPQLSLQLVPVPLRAAGERATENGLVIAFMSDPSKISPPGRGNFVTSSD